MFDDGSKPVRLVGGAVSFYGRYVAPLLYEEKVFDGRCESITVSNDSATDTITLSFDGVTVEAELSPTETLTLNTAGRLSIFIIGAAGGGNIRIWGW